MKKKAQKLLVFAVIGCFGYLLTKLVKTDFVQEKLHDGKIEDTTIALQGVLRLAGDFLGWPIDFVRALLP